VPSGADGLAAVFYFDVAAGLQVVAYTQTKYVDVETL
jgi:hypothetical protein